MSRTSRKDAPAALKFDLSILYRRLEDWKQDAQALQMDIRHLETYKGRVMDSAESLYQVLELVESLGNRFDVIRQFTHTQYMADASDADAQALASQEETLAQTFLAATAFVEPEIVQAGEMDMDSLVAAEPRLRRYSNYLHRLQEGRVHHLSAEAEQVMATLSVSIDGPNRLYGMLTNADLHPRSVTRSDGTEEAVAIDTAFFKLLLDPDRDLRSAAYKSLMGGLKAYEFTLATNYLTHVKTQVSIARLRGYDSAAEMFLTKDGIPVDFYRTALDVIMEEAKPIARRYVALQKRVQGIDEVYFYDLCAPLSKSDVRISYEEGQALIESALRVLGEEYHDFLHAAFAEKRIDLADNHGKFPIPVTLTSYGAPTYILSTWYDLLSDALTLSHELGHLVHTDFTRRKNRFDADYGMLLAETASTTNEWLLFQHLKQSGDQQRVLSGARQLIEFDFVMLIGMLFVIEKMQAEVYQKTEAGEPVSAAEISKIQARYIEEFYGEDLTLHEHDGLLWAVWPQPMYATLYPYCYSAALCMSGAIVEAIQTEGQPAVDGYLEFLQSAGSKPAPQTYEIAGIDMLNPETLRVGIRRFGRVLDDLESLL